MERMCALEKNKIQKLLWIGVSILLCCLAAWWDGGREEAEQQARQSAAQGAVSPVQTIEAVSYTHLDVYKRQIQILVKKCRNFLDIQVL